MDMITLVDMVPSKIRAAESRPWEGIFEKMRSFACVAKSSIKESSSHRLDATTFLVPQPLGACAQDAESQLVRVRDPCACAPKAVLGLRLSTLPGA